MSAVQQVGVNLLLSMSSPAPVAVDARSVVATTRFCILPLTSIDFCNAVLAGLLACTLAHLQRVLNAAARFVAGLAARAHVTDTMRLLHWLWDVSGAIYKLGLLTN